MLTRLLGPRIEAGLGMTGNLTARQAFLEEVSLLEKLRVRSGLDAEDFYLSLIRTPLADREKAVVEFLRTANPGEPLARLLAEISPITRKLR